MSDPNLERQEGRALIRREEQTEHESKTMLAIIMGGIAALFIFSIAMAFNYASHSVDDVVAANQRHKLQVQQRKQQEQTQKNANEPNKAPAVTTGSGSSTTGSGGNRS